MFDLIVADFLILMGIGCDRLLLSNLTVHVFVCESEVCEEC